MTVLVIDIQRANEEFERDKNKPILSTRKGFECPNSVLLVYKAGIYLFADRFRRSQKI